MKDTNKSTVIKFKILTTVSALLVDLQYIHTNTVWDHTMAPTSTWHKTDDGILVNIGKTEINIFGTLHLKNVQNWSLWWCT